MSYDSKTKIGLSVVFVLFVTSCVVGGVSKETNCVDGVDNNGNGLTDCDDPDCADHQACVINEDKEICDNNIDDNDNGLTDCDDPECSDHSNCTIARETICDDGIDNDGDGYTDCEDTDCVDDPACINNHENCTDGIDNTGNGLTDCDDPECQYHVACQSGDDEICDDGIDNDDNGLTDCDDPYCSNHPSCQGGEGDLSCLGINMCYNCCTAGDGECYDACDAEGTAEGQAEMNAYFECAITNCDTECDGSTPEECNICVDTYCSSETDACDWGYTNVTGCWTFMDCTADCTGTIPDGTGNASTCPSNTTLHCYQDCFSATSQQSVDKYFAIFDCIDDYCSAHCDDMGSTECQNCYGSYCGAEIDACELDG